MRRALTNLLGGGLLLMTGAQAQPLQRLDPPLSPQAPAHAEVIFSTRWERPEAISQLALYGATRVEWLYPRSTAYVAQLQAQGVRVGGTLNANITVPAEGLARDLVGQPLIAPWMQSWKAQWISITSPATQEALLQAADQQVNMGIRSLQFDDPRLNSAALEFGGEFSLASRNGFAAWLAQPEHAAHLQIPASARDGTFDFRQYLWDSGIHTAADLQTARLRAAPLYQAWQQYHLELGRQFFGRLRARLQQNNIALSLNLSNPKPDVRTFQLLDLADYVMAEIRPLSPTNIILGCRIISGTGRGFAPSVTPEDTPITRQAISLFYACGANPIVPWDVYMPDRINPDKTRSPQPRFFADPKDYADLYQFARQQQAWLDGWENAANVVLLFSIQQTANPEALALVGQLLQRHIAFSITVVDTNSPETSRPSASTAQPPLIVAAQQQTTHNVPGPIASLAALNHPQLELAQVQEPGILLLPRLHPEKPNELVVHVINTQPDPARKTLHLTFNPEVLGAQAIRAAESHQPGQTAQSLKVEPPTSLTVPAADWQILHLQLQSAESVHHAPGKMAP